MIGAIIGIIFVLIFLGIAWWGMQQLMPLLPIGEPFLTIIRVLLVILLAVIVIWVIIALLGMAGVHVPLLGMTR